uniref:RING-type E3 ubiquitin transferase n=1 Tax=Varanus komodoensis TaxID=61221 RepID=A0A8D2KS02_VARKO
MYTVLAPGTPPCGIGSINGVPLLKRPFPSWLPSLLSLKSGELAIIFVQFVLIWGFKLLFCEPVKKFSDAGKQLEFISVKEGWHGAKERGNDPLNDQITLLTQSYAYLLKSKAHCVQWDLLLNTCGELLNPCRCDGSVRYTHQLCLLKWISERGSWTCELCCYRYHVIAIKMKRPCQWQSITISLVEKVQMIAVILGSLFLLASVTWLLWSAFSPYAVWQRKDLLFQICYGMYGFMDLVCIGLIIHEGASVCRVFKRWRAVNLHWDVLNYDKATDIEESNQGESSTARTLWLPLNALRSRSLVHPTQLTSPRFQCGYVLLHLFSRMRPQEDSSDDNSSGEVVMRVTSV